MNIELTGIFMAGVLTFFTPCVLPLIPIYLSALAGSRVGVVPASGRGQLLVRSLLFSAGFIAVFSALGLGAAEIGASLSRHRAVIQFAGAAIIFTFGLKFLGLIQVPILDRVLRADDGKIASRAGALNALFMGFVFAAGWSPCVGPILGSVLTYTAARTSDAVTGAWYLAVYGAGFAAPLLLTAVFAEAGLRLLRRLSRLLPVFEKVVGALLLVAAASMFLDLGGSVVMPGKGAATQVTAKADPTVPGALPLVIEFMSKDCQICREMAPIVDALRAECDMKGIEIRQIDLSDFAARRFGRAFRIVGLPTFVFLEKDGTEAARLIGAQTGTALKQAISALRREPCPGVGRLPLDYLKTMGGEGGSSCDGASGGDPACGKP